MKTLALLSPFLLLLSAFSPGQKPPVNPLANSAWKGTVIMGEPAVVILYFKQDTLDVYTSDGQELLERGVYKVSDKTFTLRKVLGGSPCDDAAIGTCSFAIAQNVLMIKSLSDDCPARGHTWAALPYSRIAWPLKQGSTRK